MGGGSSDFFVATAGASAALAGLIIVAMSVNVDTVIRIPGMTARAAAAIALLVASTVISLAALIEEQSTFWFGVETLLIGGFALWTAVVAVVRVIRGRGKGSLASAAARSGVSVLPAALFVIGGLLALFDREEATDVIAMGALVSIPVAVLAAWVLLVEIKR